MPKLPYVAFACVALLSACVAPSSSDDASEDDSLEQTSDALTACKLTPDQRGFVKWNPGHYIFAMIPDRARQVDAFLDNYGSVAAVKGLQKTYFWSELEGDLDQYVWAQIDADIKKLAAAKKKLSIIIGYKYQVSDTKSSLPRYILDMPNATVGSTTVPSYYEQGKPGDGRFNQGQHLNFGHPSARHRFKMLLQALSNRYDGDPNVASLTFIETSIGANVTSAQDTLFLDGVMNMERFAGCAFKHTPVFQNLNFPRNRLADFASNMTQYGIGLGGPDAFFDSMKLPDNSLGYNMPGRPKGVYHYYPELAPTLPIGQQVHRANLLYSTHESMRTSPPTPHGLSPAVSVDKVYDFSMSQLKPNYLVWAVGGSTDEYATALKARLVADGLPIRKGCPAIYGGKCTSQ